MGWYSSSWSYRFPIVVDNSSAHAGTIDVTASIPVTFDHFWTNVLSNGNDIRVTGPNGVTLVTYDIDTFNTSNRTGTIEIDNATVTAADDCTVFWVYYGNSGASLGNTTFSPSTPKTGTIALESPLGARLVQVFPEPAGRLRPTTELSKSSAEYIDVYFDITQMLRTRYRASQSTARYEEIASFTFTVTTGGATQAAMVDASKNAVIEINHRIYVRCRVQGGSDGTDYTLDLRFRTSLDNTLLNARAWLMVRDVDEA